MTTKKQKEDINSELNENILDSLSDMELDILYDQIIEQPRNIDNIRETSSCYTMCVGSRGCYNNYA